MLAGSWGEHADPGGPPGGRWRVATFLSLVESKALKYGRLKRPMLSSQKELWISVSGRFR